MKRDPDLERDILLAIEAYDGESRPGYADLSGLEAPDLQVKYHVVLLHEAGFIQAIDAATLKDRFAMMPIRLTMVGHEYLDTSRDEEVWRCTKEGAQAVGSFSLDALGALAKGLMREKIRKHTGVEVDL